MPAVEIKRVKDAPRVTKVCPYTSMKVKLPFVDEETDLFRLTPAEALACVKTGSFEYANKKMAAGHKKVITERNELETVNRLKGLHHKHQKMTELANKSLKIPLPVKSFSEFVDGLTSASQ